MTKQDPEMIVTLKIPFESLDEKSKIAMDSYMGKIVNKNLDDALEKLIEKKVERRLNVIVNPPRYYSSESKINGKTLEDFIGDKTNKVIEEIIEKNIKNIFAKKVAEML